MKVKSILLGLCLAFSLVACGPKDADIQKEIAAKISALPGVDVTVKDGVATISGICKDEALKQNAESIVKGIKGVKSVVNNCEIAAPEPVATEAPVEINPDAVLTTSVNDVVKTYSGVTAAIKDGVVTLTGTIKKEQLPNLIKSVQELKPKKVENKLTIK
ncbi:osmotically-inducible protein OsmY [Flavobacterium sp. 90]|uniref:BON domain-containing protein n=1 Tax=unclassified Flavobacterium TaxID=196869 RepID=UPI000EB4296F|nr:MULTISPECIES: BON domain-containing protein [unclassified Flavobacterium]RKR11979.1 osmotically-inducible protein OsmY [Flavobacterium sp. 81]TCK55751.1 osmotically-inducible protein OsmY [Flavobacterium sp. 90]